MIIVSYKVEYQLLEKEDLMKAITNGTIMTITKGIIPNGTVLINDKKMFLCRKAARLLMRIMGL